MPIKVLHVINDLSIGGSELMLYRLLAQMERTEFEPTVVSLKDRGNLRQRIEALNIPIFSAGMTTPLSAATAVHRLRRLACHIDAELIQGWMYHGSLAALLMRSCSEPRARVLWGIRNSISVPRQEKRMTSAVIRLGAYFSRRPEGIVYVSQASQSQHQALGYSNANTFVVANGFDTALFRPSTELRAEVRAELGVPDSVILIGMIGRYHPSKDHLNFLRAAALLQNQGDIRFVLCGRGVDPDNSSIKTTSGELGISERLLLLGERHDIPRLMTGLDVLVSSSSNEAFPNVIGEAMSCGVPCVATDVGDVRSLLGGTGNITPPRDPQALAQGLSRLIDSGHEGRKLLGHAARSRIVDRFSIEAVARQYESLYEKTAAGQLDGKQSEMD